MPWAASASVRERMAFAAPRILKEPVFWKLSHLKKNCAPAMASSEWEVRTGVRWMRGAIRACASQMSSQVGGRKFADSTCGAVLMGRLDAFEIFHGRACGGSRATQDRKS